MSFTRSFALWSLTLLFLLSCKNVENEEVITTSPISNTALKEIGTAEYQQWVNSHPVVVVDFSATWCGPCKKLSPLMEKLSRQRKSDFKLYTIDVDENQSIAQQNEVEVLPTLLWYKNGKLAKRMYGLQSEKVINQLIDELVK